MVRKVNKSDTGCVYTRERLLLMSLVGSSDSKERARSEHRGGLYKRRKKRECWEEAEGGEEDVG